MPVGAGLSISPDAQFAAESATEAAADGLDGRDADLTVVFASPAHLDALASVAETVRKRLAPRVLVGAIAQGVVGPGREVESGPAVSVWATSIGEDAEVLPFRSWALPRQQGGMAVAGWPDTEAGDLVLLLADPFSYPAAQVVRRVGAAPIKPTILGGLVTGGREQTSLVLNGSIHEDGAVGAVVRGAAVRTVVSQGCRPVGKPLTVTAAEGNVIRELAGEPAVERLRAMFAEAGDEDRRRMQQGLHIGLVADEYREEFETGDFLIRAVLGADEEAGGVVVGDLVEVGQVVQFQVRDADSAHDDLARHLADVPDADGALLFTCNGRGERFFGRPDHDVEEVARYCTDVVGGAFCAGEIGPVGQQSFVHGFTASMAVFGPGTTEGSGA